MVLSVRSAYIVHFLPSTDVSILIEEGGILELRPYLIERLCLSEVYLEPFVVLLRIPVGMTGFPERAVVVIHGILRLEPFVVIATGCNLGAEGEILF